MINDIEKIIYEIEDKTGDRFNYEARKETFKKLNRALHRNEVSSIILNDLGSDEAFAVMFLYKMMVIDITEIKTNGEDYIFTVEAIGKKVIEL